MFNVVIEGVGQNSLILVQSGNGLPLIFGNLDDALEAWEPKLNGRNKHLWSEIKNRIRLISRNDINLDDFQQAFGAGLDLEHGTHIVMNTRILHNQSRLSFYINRSFPMYPPPLADSDDDVDFSGFTNNVDLDDLNI